MHMIIHEATLLQPITSRFAGTWWMLLQPLYTAFLRCPTSCSVHGWHLLTDSYIRIILPSRIPVISFYFIANGRAALGLPGDVMSTSMKSHRARDTVTLLQREMPEFIATERHSLITKDILFFLILISLFYQNLCSLLLPGKFVIISKL